MNLQQYEFLTRTAHELDRLMGVRGSIERQRLAAIKADAMPVQAGDYLAECAGRLRVEERALWAHLRPTKRGILYGDPLSDHVRDTPGVGPAALFLLGLIPPLAAIEGVEGYFPNPAKLWRYLGLHPEGGRRAKRGEVSGYSRRLKAYALQRVGLPCVRLAGDEGALDEETGEMEGYRDASPYRAVYDKRRERTAVTHALMLAAGEGCASCDEAYGATKAYRKERQFTRERTAVAAECSAFGGPHWTAGHQHADAIRVTTKAIVLDLWLVANGKAPKLGAVEV